MTTTIDPPEGDDDSPADPDRFGRHAAAGTAVVARPRTADKVRLVARGVGQTLITAGVVILLFVVYEVWVTNIFAASEQAKVHTQYLQALADTVGTGELALPGATQSTAPTGSGIANLYVPRFGKDYDFTIVEGIDDASLEKGPGHYPGTALPGQTGNFAVAGHRVGKGNPFLNLDQLQPGDPIVVQVQGFWYVYKVLGTNGDLAAQDANGVPGREIVSPADVDVIAPTPDKAGSAPTSSYMTMTTCHPKYSASQRMVVHAILAATKPAQGTALPSELGGTF